MIIGSAKARSDGRGTASGRSWPMRGPAVGLVESFERTDDPLLVVPQVETGGAGLTAFVVKLRNVQTKSWGDQTEVFATSAKEAAEQLSGERLIEGVGERADMRARVWAMPFGSQPDRAFYIDRSVAPRHAAAARDATAFTIVAGTDVFASGQIA